MVGSHGVNDPTWQTHKRQGEDLTAVSSPSCSMHHSAPVGGEGGGAGSPEHTHWQQWRHSGVAWQCAGSLRPVAAWLSSIRASRSSERRNGEEQREGGASGEASRGELELRRGCSGVEPQTNSDEVTEDPMVTPTTRPRPKLCKTRDEGDREGRSHSTTSSKRRRPW
jgi:hypothetical protein